MIKLLMIRPLLRTDHHLKMIRIASTYITFFRKMSENRLYIDKKVLENCCRKINHRFALKGTSVIVKGSSLILIPIARR